MTLYWDIGKRIVETQKEMGWEKSVVEQLAQDLRREFPDVKGFSARNLWKIQAFYRVYSRNEQKLPQNVAESDGINLRQLVAEIEELHSVWIIQCKSKKGLVAEYSLRDMANPLVYQNTSSRPNCRKNSAVNCRTHDNWLGY